MRAWIELKTTDPRLDHCTLAYFGDVGVVRLWRIRRRFRRWCEANTRPFSVAVLTTSSRFGHDQDTNVLLLDAQALAPLFFPYFADFYRSEWKWTPHITVPTLDYVPSTVTFNAAILRTREMF